MKLLFDQNLAPALVRRLEDLFPGSEHVHEIGLGEAPDRAVWEYARDRGLVIASKDSDFHQLAVLEGPPPKVVWVRLGNGPVSEVEHELRRRHAAIVEFGKSAAAFLVVGAVD